MIKDFKTLKLFLKLDAIANNKVRKIPLLFTDYEWRFLRSLRFLEFFIAQRKGKMGWLFLIPLFISKIRWHLLSVKTGISIYPNCFDYGLTLWHYGSIIVNPNVKGGKFVTISSDVNISENVEIGDWVYIGPGVKILHNLMIENHIQIGANSVVTKSLTKRDSVYFGIPASWHSTKGYYRSDIQNQSNKIILKNEKKK